MTSDRIKEIQETTAHPNSTSVMLALKQVWNECEQSCNQTNAKLVEENKRLREGIIEGWGTDYFKLQSELCAAKERIKELEEATIFNNSELVKLREIIQLKEDAYSDIGNKYSHALLRIKEHEKFFKWVIKGDRKLNDYRLKAIELIDPTKYGKDN